jgi:hypothetical protein
LNLRERVRTTRRVSLEKFRFPALTSLARTMRSWWFGKPGCLMSRKACAPLLTLLTTPTGTCLGISNTKLSQTTPSKSTHTRFLSSTMFRSQLAKSYPWPIRHLTSTTCRKLEVKTDFVGLLTVEASPALTTPT